MCGHNHAFWRWPTFENPTFLNISTSKMLGSILVSKPTFLWSKDATVPITTVAWPKNIDFQLLSILHNTDSGGTVGLSENPSAFKEMGGLKAWSSKVTENIWRLLSKQEIFRAWLPSWRGIFSEEKSQVAGYKSDSGHQRAGRLFPWRQWWVIGSRHTECHGWINSEHSAESGMSKKGSVCQIW